VPDYLWNANDRLFAPAAAHLDDCEEFMIGVTQWIQAHVELIDAWRHYSEDKRGSGPYLSEHIGSSYDPLVVGFQRGDGSKCDQTHHTDEVAACVDFIYRESI
jgi:hypothetical protein